MFTASLEKSLILYLSLCAHAGAFTAGVRTVVGHGWGTQTYDLFYPASRHVPFCSPVNTDIEFVGIRAERSVWGCTQCNMCWYSAAQDLLRRMIVVAGCAQSWRACRNAAWLLDALGHTWRYAR